MAKTNITNGVAKINHVIPIDKQAGDYNVTALYEETDSYKESTQTSLLKVRNSTTVTVADVVTNIGLETMISASIKSGNANITGGQVQFYINTNQSGNSGYGTPIGNPVTVTDGVASTTFTPTSENTVIDQNTITAEYLGNNTYIAAVGTGILDIRDKFGITITPVVASKGETVQIPITLTTTGANTDNLNDIEALLTIWDGQTQLTDYTIDLTENESISRFIGGGTVNLALNSDIPANQYTIKIETAATDDFEETSTTSTLTIKRNTNIQAINVSANQGAGAKIGAKVTDEFGANVTTGAIQITLPDNSQSTLQIGNSEWNTTIFQVSNDAIDGSDLTYSVKYVGTGTLYEDSQVTNGTIHIRRTTTITMADITGTVGDTVEISATIKDNSNNPITEGEIEFTVY